MLDETSQIYRMTLTFYYTIGGNSFFEQEQQHGKFNNLIRKTGKAKGRSFHPKYNHTNAAFHFIRHASRR